MTPKQPPSPPPLPHTNTAFRVNPADVEGTIWSHENIARMSKVRPIADEFRRMEQERLKNRWPPDELMEKILAWKLVRFPVQPRHQLPQQLMLDL